MGNGDTAIETVYITGLETHEAQQLKEMKQASGKTWKGWLLGLRDELNRLYNRTKILKEHLEFKNQEIEELKRRLKNHGDPVLDHLLSQGKPEVAPAAPDFLEITWKNHRVGSIWSAEAEGEEKLLIKIDPQFWEVRGSERHMSLEYCTNNRLENLSEADVCFMQITEDGAMEE